MKNFDELQLSEPIRRALTELEFKTPSPIQAQALPLLLLGPTDFIGLAATGTGKTAAFAIPLLEQLDPNKKGVQVLILCPTRELAIQLFALYLESPAGQQIAVGATQELKGRHLACWCGEGLSCHGDILLAVANRNNAAAQSQFKTTLTRRR